MSQLAEIRSNDPALAACTLQPYPQLSAHALFAAELPSVCPMDASEHGEQHIEKTGSSLLGGSVAAFVDKHCSDADGRVSCGGRPRAAASRRIVGRFVCLWHPLPASTLYRAPLHRMIWAALGRSLSFVRPLGFRRR